MARTRLFTIVQHAMNGAGAPSGPRALSRRQALLLGGAGALAACAPIHLPFGSSRAPAQGIAIVGGGVAGLTAAYRLAKAGKQAVLYEASPRFGGRMFTKKNFNAEGMFCELGGELVDSNHKPLMDLAAELGVGIQRLKPAKGAGEDIYAFGDRLHTEHELLHKGKGAFVPIARRIARDHAKLTDKDDNWTEHARTLDRKSIAEYLAPFKGRVAPWVLELLDIAYWGEYGVPIAEQSSLNLIDLIGTDTKSDFQMFGESDEAYRIEGGSSSLPNALFTALGTGVAKKPAYALANIAHEKDAFVLSFTTPDGPITAKHSTVILALPFTKLREVAGLDALSLSPMKLKCIRELGYGDNAKVMIGTTGRPWDGEAHLPVKSSGEFYSREFQVMWDTSRGQEGERGILTNYLSGVQDQATALAGIHAGWKKLSPAIEATLDENNLATFFWQRYQFNKGSFSAPKVGQYTTLLEVAGLPEFDGKLQFAGEHTSTDYAGFMCGGVDSGNRAAAAVLAVGQGHADAALRQAA